MSAEVNIYVVRPNGTALWIPDSVAARMRLQSGDTLTVKQYESDDIQGLIARRIAAEKGRKATS